MSNALDWELVVETQYDSARTPLPPHRVFRAPVPGGWLVMLSTGGEQGQPKVAAGLTFVPGTEWVNGKP